MMSFSALENDFLKQNQQQKILAGFIYLRNKRTDHNNQIHRFHGSFPNLYCTGEKKSIYQFDNMLLPWEHLVGGNGIKNPSPGGTRF